MQPPGGATYEPAARGTLVLALMARTAAHCVTEGVAERDGVDELDGDAPTLRVGEPVLVADGVPLVEGVRVGVGVGGMHDSTRT